MDLVVLSDSVIMYGVKSGGTHFLARSIKGTNSFSYTIAFYSEAAYPWPPMGALGKVLVNPAENRIWIFCQMFASGELGLYMFTPLNSATTLYSAYFPNGGYSSNYLDMVMDASGNVLIFY